MNEEFEAEGEMSEDQSGESLPNQSAAEEKEPTPAAESEDRTAADVIPELTGPSLASVIDVPLRITVEVGTAKMLVREVLQLNKGSVVPLDRASGDPADILVNGRLIARGEVTALDDSLAVRIVELIVREQNGSER